MQKKILTWLLACLFVGALSLGAACGDNSAQNGGANGEQTQPTEIEAVYAQYVTYAEGKGETPLSYEDWLASIKGEKGDQGVGIEKIEYDEDGNLVITLTDGTQQTVSMPEKEEEGTPGLHYQRIAGKDEYRVIGLGMAAELDIVIPSTYNGLPVTEIGERAFDEETYIASVVIPDSVTSIGFRAFYNCESLTSVVISDSVMSIQEFAFSECNNSIVYCEAESKPSGWASQWNSNEGSYTTPVVWDCNNNEVATDGCIYTMVDGVRYALKEGEATVARQVTNIQTVKILDVITYKNVSYSVTSIGYRAFFWCESLTSLTFNGTVEEWNAIEKGAEWNNKVPATEVVCSNGTVAL